MKPAAPRATVRARALTNVHALIAVGVNADGHREILGLGVTAEDEHTA